MPAPHSSRPRAIRLGSATVRLLSCLALGLASVAILTASAASQGPSYAAVDLGLPSDFIEARPTALNHSGQIVGVCEDKFYFSSGFVWSHATGIQLIRSLRPNNEDLAPSAIGADGTIVGGLGYRGAIVVRDGWTSHLPILGGLDGYLWSATAINQSGLIVGYAYYPPFLPYGDISLTPDHAFLTDGSAIAEVGFIGAMDGVDALALNDRGDIVGVAGVSSLYRNEAPQVFMYTGSGFSLIPASSGFAPATASSINNRRTVAGYGYTHGNDSSSSQRHGYLYANGQLTDLGAPAGYIESRLESINDAGQAVGYAASSGSSSGIYYSPSTGLIPLPAPTLIRGPDGQLVTDKTVRWIDAAAINDVGMIAATGVYSDGSTHAFLLTPLDATPIAIASQPAAQTVRSGTSTTLSVAVSGQGTIHYQWTKDGVPVPGATESSLTIDHVLPADTGQYAVVVSNAVSEVTSATATVQLGNSQLVNLSGRVRCGTGDDTAITGFVIAGHGTKKVLLRAIGSSLVAQGLSRNEVLLDPMMELHDTKRIIATNDDWWATNNGAEVTRIGASVGASAIASDDVASSARRLDLAPGAYTFLTTGKGGTAGIALNEVYDSDPASAAARLVNVSVRARCGSGNAVTIGGFVVAGPATKRVLVRAVGPALSALGVTGTLQDPLIEVHDQLHGNAVIATNDNWGDFAGPDDVAATARRVGAMPELTNDPKSAAMVLTLAPGVYSFVARAKDNGAGVVLIEAYDAD